jgi:SAM-dependent methyltransferase
VAGGIARALAAPRVARVTPRILPAPAEHAGDTARLALEWQRHWLADAPRTQRFADAVRRAVAGGRDFVDLGCGHGLMSLAARRAGAGRIIAIESARATVDLAARVLAANGASDVELIHGHSEFVTLDDRVDVIAMDFIGDSGFSPHHVRCLLDARDRWLRPGGTLIPAAIEMRAALARRVTPPDSEICVWQGDAADLVSRVVAVGEYDLGAMTSPIVRAEARIPVSAAARAEGVVWFFRAVLHAGDPPIELTNEPGAPERSARPGYFVPFDAALNVEAGDAVLARVTGNAQQDTYRYSATLERPGVAARVCGVSTYPVPDLWPARPAQAAPRPRLNADGLAALEALRARIDGVSEGRVIADLVASGALPTLAAARRFLRKLVDP